MNKVILIGRLGQDPKLEYLPSGTPVVEFTLATDESYKDKDGNKVDQCEWHRIKVFNKAAEFAAKWLAKGGRCCVEGHLKTRSWEDRDSGGKRYITEVVVSAPQDRLQPIDWANPGEDQGQGAPTQQRANSGQKRGGYSGHSQGQGRGDSGRDQAVFPSDAGGMDDIPF